MVKIKKDETDKRKQTKKIKQRWNKRQYKKRNEGDEEKKKGIREQGK